MTEKHLNIGDRELHYTLYGSGKPVLLIHGFGEDSQIWDRQVAGLGDGFQLIVPDLPGSGKSDMIDNMTMEGMADAMMLVLKNEGISECVVIGHSMGGYVSLALADTHASAVLGLGLVHSSAYADNDEKKAARRKNIEFIRKHGSHAFLKQSVPNLFSENYRTENPEVVDALVEQYKDFNPAGLIACLEAMMKRPDRTGILKTIQQPVLFIMGRHDNAVPFAQSLEQSALPQISYIHILDNSGHMGMWEETEKTNEALVSFFRDVYVI